VTESLRVFAVFALAAALVACSGEDPVRPLCPASGILPDANAIVLFRDGAGRDITDVVAQAQIVDIKVDCKYAAGRRDRPSVSLDLQIAFAAERGPADRSRRAAMPYFVAIVDAERNVVVKDNFVAAFEWTDNRPRVGRVDQWEPYIPLKNNFEGPSYQIVVGFQLTAEQLAWNRAQRAAR
jgi:hypothetical protein